MPRMLVRARCTFSSVGLCFRLGEARWPWRRWCRDELRRDVDELDAGVTGRRWRCCLDERRSDVDECRLRLDESRSDVDERRLFLDELRL